LPNKVPVDCAFSGNYFYKFFNKVPEGIEELAYCKRSDSKNKPGGRLTDGFSYLQEVVIAAF